MTSGKYLISILLCLFFFHKSFSQGYSYVQYNTKEGLAGSTVYCIAQDKNGFIWFGTETGISRFDGKHFKNFTVADGLPTNEIFGLFVDSKNRIWMMAFKNTICYYENGKIHNPENDTTLSKFTFSSPVAGYAENAAGDILVRNLVENMDRIENYIIRDKEVIPVILDKTNSKSSALETFDAVTSSGSLPIRMTNIPDYVRAAMDEDQLTSIEAPLISKNTNLKYFVCHRDNIGAAKDKRNILVFSGDKRVGTTVSLPPTTNFVHYINSYTLALVRSHNGLTLFDLDKMKIVENLFSHLNVVFVMEDVEKNLWFGTKGMGAIKLSDSRFKNYNFNNLGVRDIRRINNKIYIGTDENKYWSISALNKKSFKTDIGKTPCLEKGSLSFIRKHEPNASINQASSNFLELGTDVLRGSCKTMQLNADTLFISSSSLSYTFEISKNRLLDTIFVGRSNCGYYTHGNYYIGTLNGLYQIGPGNARHFLGDQFPILRSRINQITEDKNGIIWVATNGDGIVGYKNGKVFFNIGRGDGLTSGICRFICCEGNNLWVGTDKGLNKVVLNGTGYTVTEKITEADGLSSGMINSLYYDNGNMYVGTPLGLNIFDATSTPKRGLCNIILTDVVVSGKSKDLSSSLLELNHSDNNIRFDFSGISFLSGGNITYKYRLLGLNSSWQLTSENSLSYPSLPSGNYNFQIIAINKFGNESKSLEFHFEIKKLIWEYWWFQLLTVITIVLITAAAVSSIVRRTNKIEKEKLLSAQKILELEQMALRAQMNPHFVFNSLNSLQQYILNKDVRSANFYLSRFAGLVRQTLENATRINIPISEEITYLKTYIDLERMQTLEGFNYTLVVDDTINQETLTIPNMVLQPYVENAIKHGVLPLKGGGLVSIEFQLANSNTLKCIITDNGVGIDKNILDSKYIAAKRESYGLSITDKRISTLNQLNGPDHHITLEIIDLKSLDSSLTGTRVTINFPILNI